jgi:hypothetical protein
VITTIKSSFAAVSLAAVCLALPAKADKLADFKKAAASVKAQKGCESIPYAALETECRSAQERVTKYCKTNEMSCKATLKKADLKTRFERAKGCLASRKQVKAVFEKAKAKLAAEPAKDIKRLVPTLHDFYVSGERGHAQAIRQTQTVADTCEQFLGANR